MPTDTDRRIWIANDHGGYTTKVELVRYFEDHDVRYRDLGCESEEIVRYPYYAGEVASAISRGEIARGVLICSTGIGMSLVANRYRGVRASHCTSTYQARMTRAHNDSNILCLGGRVTGVFEAIDMLAVWLATAYEGGRHDISLGLLEEAERSIAEVGDWDPSRIVERR
jgi:ribose 5-phosphate isomerase B